MQALTFTDSFTCTVPWAPVANEPSKYTVGECANGWHLHRQDRSSEVTLPASEGGGKTYFDGGYFYGNLNHCGWVDYGRDKFAASGTFSECSPQVSFPLNTFASVVNCAPAACTDGTAADNASSCLEVGNVAPWSSTPTATDYIRTVPAHYKKLDVNGNPTATPGLLWRYVVGANGVNHYDAYGNLWTMVRDANHTIGEGNWVFVPYSCLTYPPPPANQTAGYYVTHA